MFFGCHLLTSYWTAIQTMVSAIFNTPTALSFAMVTLGPWASPTPLPLDSTDMALLDLLLTIAVKIILMEWKSFQHLSYHTWWAWVSYLCGAHTSLLGRQSVPPISSRVWWSFDWDMELSSKDPLNPATTEP